MNEEFDKEIRFDDNQLDCKDIWHKERRKISKLLSNNSADVDWTEDLLILLRFRFDLLF